MIDDVCYAQMKNNAEDAFYTEEVAYSLINGKYFLHKGSTVRAPGIRNEKINHEQRKKHERRCSCIVEISRNRESRVRKKKKEKRRKGKKVWLVVYYSYAYHE
jgi:hypothetical protein